MNILVREPEGTWRSIRSHKYEGEGSLQDLLYRSPGIIPLESLGSTRRLPRLFVREVGLSASAYADLISVDEAGSITIVECKLASNPEIKRKVIGQLLEYVGYLWKQSYNSFDAMCRRAEGWSRPLSEEMAARVTKPNKDWCQEQFVAAVTATLNTGDFNLIIAVDRITDQLKRTIDFVDERERTGVHICALEMIQYAPGGL